MVERARPGQQGRGAWRGGAFRRGGRRRRIHGNFLVFAVSFNKARTPAQPFSRSKVNGSRQKRRFERLRPQRGHGPLPLGRRRRRITVEVRLSAIRTFRLMLVALLIAASPARAASDDTTAPDPRFGAFDPRRHRIGAEDGQSFRFRSRRVCAPPATRSPPSCRRSSSICRRASTRPPSASPS